MTGRFNRRVIPCGGDYWRAVFLPRRRDGLDDDRGLRGHRPGAWSHRPAGEALAGGGEGVGIGLAAVDECDWGGDKGDHPSSPDQG